MSKCTQEGSTLPLTTLGCCSNEYPCIVHLKQRAEDWQEVSQKARESAAVLEKLLAASQKENDRLREVLHKIATFGHVSNCDCKGAPIYECGCYDKSQWFLAQEALDCNKGNK